MFTVEFSGNLSRKDRRAARRIVREENKRRELINQQRRGILDDDGNQVEPDMELLPAENGAQLKASYLTMMAEIVAKAHDSYAEQEDEKDARSFRKLYKAADDDKRAAAEALLRGE